jgi:tetratricopeptide (TPR) repeat protein
VCRFATFLLVVLMVTVAALPGFSQSSAAPTTAAQSSPAQAAEDWEARVRALLIANNPQDALEVAAERLAQAPGDMEALGWHGRALVQLGRLPEAEAEFRRVLAAYPNDTDIQLDLASIARRQGHAEEALALLNRARKVDPRRADLAREQGRVLNGLGRTAEARESFHDAERLAPGDPETREALASIEESPRQELRIGTDIDTFNYTDTAGAFTLGLRSAWMPKWTTVFDVSYFDRFGGQAVRNEGAVTFKAAKRTGITAGGAWNHDDGVIPRSEAFFEIDQGAPIPGRHFVRGLEVLYHQHWYWYSTARVLALTQTLIVYLPRDWIWQVSVTSARSSFPGLAPSWRPSGTTKLTFPIVPRLTGNIFFAVGSEDYALMDQLGRFSAHTWGGGLRWQFARRQFVTGYVLNQDRTAHRTQTSFGLGYGVRF